MAALRQKHKDNGYLLAEWLMSICLYGIVVSGLNMGIAGYEKTLAAVQVENAAREFAQDILQTRERALAGSDLSYIELSSGRKGDKIRFHEVNQIFIG